MGWAGAKLSSSRPGCGFHKLQVESAAVVFELLSRRGACLSNSVIRAPEFSGEGAHSPLSVRLQRMASINQRLETIIPLDARWNRLWTHILQGWRPFSWGCPFPLGWWCQVWFQTAALTAQPVQSVPLHPTTRGCVNARRFRLHPLVVLCGSNLIRHTAYIFQEGHNLKVLAEGAEFTNQTSKLFGLV